MAAFDQGPIAKYNSLTDRHLMSYFNNDRMRRHLVKNGLVTKEGEVVSDAVYRIRIARREHRRRVRDLIAQAIIHKALEMERSRQIDIRKKIEEISKIELVRRVRTDRSRVGDEECLAYFNEGNMEVKPRSRKARTRSLKTQSDFDETKLPTTPDQDSKHRLRKLLPNEEIETKHLSQLDSLTLGEYAKILEKQDRYRINKLPYLGMGNEFVRHKPKPPSKNKKKVNSKNTQKKETDDTALTQSARSSQPKGPGLTPVCILFHAPSNNRNFEVMVEQQPSGGNTLILYKQSITNNTILQVLSHRHKGFPFSLTFYIDNVKDSRISTCCEYKHKIGKRIGGPSGHFSLFSVEGDSPCFRCLAERDLENEKKGKNKKGTKSTEQGSSRHETISVRSTSEDRYKSDDEFMSDNNSAESGSENEEEDDADKKEDLKKSENEEEDRQLSSAKSRPKENEIKVIHDPIPPTSDRERTPEIEVKDDNVTQEEIRLSSSNNNAAEFTGGHDKDHGDRGNAEDGVQNSNSPIGIKRDSIDLNNGASTSPNDKSMNVNSSSPDLLEKEDKKKEVSVVKQDEERIYSSTDESTEDNNKKTVPGQLFILPTTDNSESESSSNRQDLQKQPSTAQPPTKSTMLSGIEFDSDESSSYGTDTESEKDVKLTNKDTSQDVYLGMSVLREDESPRKEDVLVTSNDNIELVENIPEDTGMVEVNTVGDGNEWNEKLEDHTNDEDNARKMSISDAIITKERPPTSPDASYSEHSDSNKPIVTSNGDIYHVRDNAGVVVPIASVENSETLVLVDRKQAKQLSSEATTDSGSVDYTSSSLSDEESSDVSTERDAKNVIPASVLSDNERESLRIELPKDEDENISPNSDERGIEEPRPGNESPIPSLKGNGFLVEIGDMSRAKRPSEAQNEHATSSSAPSTMSSSTLSDTDSESVVPIKVEHEVEEGENGDDTVKKIDTEEFDISFRNDDVTFKKAKDMLENVKDRRVKSLTIRDCELPSHVFNLIANKLESQKDLKRIELSNCEVEIGMLKMLAKALDKWPSLETLIISNNVFADYCFFDLTNIIEYIYADDKVDPKASLKTFEVSNCALKENDFELIVKLIANNTRVENFVLDGNVIDEKLWKELKQALDQNTNTKSVSLINCVSDATLLEEIDKWTTGDTRSRLILK